MGRDKISKWIYFALPCWLIINNITVKMSKVKVLPEEIYKEQIPTKFNLTASNWENTNAYAKYTHTHTLNNNNKNKPMKLAITTDMRVTTVR